MSPVVLIHRTLLVLLAVVGVAGVLHLGIAGGEVLAAQLADVLVVAVAAEEALADVIQIVVARRVVILLVIYDPARGGLPQVGGLETQQNVIGGITSDRDPLMIIVVAVISIMSMVVMYFILLMQYAVDGIAESYLRSE